MRRCISLVLLLLLLVPSVSLAQGTEIVLSFTGDCTIGSEDWRRPYAYSFDSYINQFGYAYPFEKVRFLFARDDVTVINLEGVFYEYAANRAEKTYNFRGPVDFVNVLTRGGIDLNYVGNNHIMDYGIYGFRSTVKVLEEAGQGWFAVTDEAVKTHIFEKNGIKIGFTGAYLSYWYRGAERIKQSFQELKDAGCDFIVGVMHGGVEYSPRQQEHQERFARFLVDQGAGFVVGHHPHVLHGVDIYAQANIVYSLGNFSFGGNPKLRATDTAIAQLTLRFAEDGRYQGQILNLIPAHVSGTLEYNNYQPVLLRGAAAQQVIDNIQAMSTYSLQPYKRGIGAVQELLPPGEPPLVPHENQSGE